MKAGIVFTGSGPIVIITSYGSLSSPELIEKLSAKGINKYFVHEVPEDKVQQVYGRQYKSVLSDLQQDDDLRVLDFDGHHIFSVFKFSELSTPIYQES